MFTRSWTWNTALEKGNLLKMIMKYLKLNFKYFSRRDIKFYGFSRTEARFKDFSRRGLKFKSFSRPHEPCFQ